MTRPLRIRHRRIFMVLGLLLPILFGLGIAARKPVPFVVNLPAGLSQLPRSRAVNDWEQVDIFKPVPVYLHTLRATAPEERRAIAFSADADFVKPDLLVYWQPGMVASEERLPTDARLLGAFDAPELRLPAEATQQAGAFILYSLADAEVVAVSRQVRFDEARK